MASRFWTKFSQLKVTAGTPPSAREGVTPSSGKVTEKTASWTRPGPASKGFGKAGAVPVKTNPTSYGMQ